jgi:hypothetical protein
MLCLIFGECKIYLETAKTFKQIKHGMTEAKMVLHQVTVSDADLCCYLSLQTSSKSCDCFSPLCADKLCKIMLQNIVAEWFAADLTKHWFLLVTAD